MTEPAPVASAEAVRAAAEARARLKHLTAQREITAALLATRRADLAAMERVLKVEQSDVRRLEQLSPTKVWATLRGNAADRLAIERAQADAAELAVAAARSRLAIAVAEDERIRREHSELRGAEGEYRDALASYELSLLTAGGAEASELKELAEHLGEAQARLREVTEAVDALRAARSALDDALAKLDSAGGWSTYDVFFGGGLVADMVKHSKIDDATQAFTSVNRALERLSVELADIGGSTVEGVDVSDTLAVFDVLFDNIISDWMVRDRIAQARAHAQDLRQRLAQLADELGPEEAALSASTASMLQRREAILTAR